MNRRAACTACRGLASQRSRQRVFSAPGRRHVKGRKQTHNTEGSRALGFRDCERPFDRSRVSSFRCVGDCFAQKKVMVSQQQLDKLRAENRKLLDEARAVNRMPACLLVCLLPACLFVCCMLVCLFVRSPFGAARNKARLPCSELSRRRSRHGSDPRLCRRRGRTMMRSSVRPPCRSRYTQHSLYIAQPIYSPAHKPIYSTAYT